MLPTKLIHMIAAFAGERRVIRALKYGMTPQQYRSFYMINSRTLIYGEVQSGKTARLVQELTQSSLPCVLIIQNSCLLQQQYMDRLTGLGIEYQCVNNKTRVINKRNVIIMNNSYQINKYTSLPTRHSSYNIILDESDMTCKNPLRQNACNEIHVTATPFINIYKNYFDKVVKVKTKQNYYGLDRIKILPTPVLNNTIDYHSIIESFQQHSKGMMLINSINHIVNMTSTAKYIAKHFPTMPVLLLTTFKKIFLNHKETRISTKNISKILDGFKGNVIIIANRMSSRGISYTNSDYSRHITHQITTLTTSPQQRMTSFLQKCRIFGVYTDSPDPVLYVPEKCVPLVEQFKKKISDRSFLRGLLKEKPIDKMYTSI